MECQLGKRVQVHCSKNDSCDVYRDNNMGAFAELPN